MESPRGTRSTLLVRTIALGLSIICLATPSMGSDQVQTFTAMHTYILGDHDSKDDARQRCLLEVKRKILEQAGVYIESASEVKNFDLTKDKITSFSATVMQVKDIKERGGFENGHMTMTLTTTAQVDLAEMRKQLATRQVEEVVANDDTNYEGSALGAYYHKTFDSLIKPIQQYADWLCGLLQPVNSPTQVYTRRLSDHPTVTQRGLS